MHLARAGHSADGRCVECAPGVQRHQHDVVPVPVPVPVPGVLRWAEGLRRPVDVGKCRRHLCGDAGGGVGTTLRVVLLCDGLMRWAYAMWPCPLQDFVLGPFGTSFTKAAAAAADAQGMLLVAGNAAGISAYKQGFDKLFGVVTTTDRYTKGRQGGKGGSRVCGWMDGWIDDCAIGSRSWQARSRCLRSKALRRPASSTRPMSSPRTRPW